MMQIRAVVVPVIGTFSLLVAVARSQDAGPPGKSAAPPAKSAAPPAKSAAPAAEPATLPAKSAVPSAKPAPPPKPASRVLAIVNGESIISEDVEGHLDSMRVPADRRDSVRAKVLDVMIENTVLIQHLEKQKVTFDEVAVDAQISQTRKRLEAQGLDFAATLGQFGLTEQKLRRQLAARSRWINYVKTQFNDEQAQAYLDEHHEEFDGTTVRASHILVMAKADVDAGTRASAKSKLAEVQKELKSGKAFADLARRHSDCPSKEQGGDLGFFARNGAMVEPFAAAAFALKNGETSGVVETDFGYHLIRVTDRKPGKPVTLDAVREQILQKMGERLRDTLLAERMKAAQIERPGATAAAESKPAKK